MPAIRDEAGEIHAFRALAALEAYEMRVDALVAGSPAANRHDLRAHLARLQACCAPSGALTVAWLALLISHFELLGALDEVQRLQRRRTQERAAQAAQRHALCMRQLASACRRQLLQGHDRPARAGSPARERRALRDRLAQS